MSRYRSRGRLSAVLVALVTALALVIPGVQGSAVAQPVDPVVSAATQVEQAVVRLDTRIDYQNAVGVGAGVVLSPEGAVLTNYHVVQGADVITATLDGVPYQADLVGYHRSRDVAVLQLRGAGGLPTAPIGSSSQLAVGEPVVALGNANGSRAPLTREYGTVTGFDRTVNAEDILTGATDELSGLFEFAAPVRAGDSGGPVVNGAGQVVGVTTAASVDRRMGPGGRGFAIPIDSALPVVDQIRARVPSNDVHIGPPTLLGVGVRTAPLRNRPGVFIQDVLIGGPAEAAGLRPGDILIVLDDTRLDSATTLTTVLDRRYPGDVVDLVWLDASGQERTGKAMLTSSV